MQSPTNGFFYVIDRLTGELISAGKDRQSHLGRSYRSRKRPTGRSRQYPLRKRPYRDLAQRVWDSQLARHVFQPATGLVYIPYMQLGARYTDGSVPWPSRRSAASSAVSISSCWFAILTTIPERCSLGTPSLRRRVGAYHVRRCGTEGYYPPLAAWYFRAPPMANSSPTMHQRSSTLAVRCRDRNHCEPCQLFGRWAAIHFGSGRLRGGATPLAQRTRQSRLEIRRTTAPAVDLRARGAASLPPSAPRDYVVHALDDPDVVIDTAAARDLAQYQQRCSGCHGRLLASAGAPRSSRIPRRAALGQFPHRRQGRGAGTKTHAALRRTLRRAASSDLHVHPCRCAGQPQPRTQHAMPSAAP